eukprot:gene21594-25631_t
MPGLSLARGLDFTGQATLSSLSDCIYGIWFLNPVGPPRSATKARTPSRL